MRRLGFPVVEPLFPLRERSVWSVDAVVHAVADLLAARFPGVTIRGEVSGFSRAGSGHCYLSLKDADGGNALIRCALFRRAASLLDFVPADGQLVEAWGRLAVYEPRGDLQFVIESMHRAGVGALFEQFLRLRARLESEGLFDPLRKRALPRFPWRIGIVTSLGAAALHDVLAALARRTPHVGIVVYPSPVQGAEAPSALVEALALAGRRMEVDVLILCRGGGSLEDLWSFNDERLVRALVACPLPVVCGVGHETDVTLADLAADLRAPTPTAAAEMISPTRRECLDLLAALAAVMSNRVHQWVDARAQRLDHAARRLKQPAEAVGWHAQRLLLFKHRLGSSMRQVTGSHLQGQAVLAARLQRSLKVTLTSRGQRLAGLAARLDSSDPARVLSRGYAWLADACGHPVLSVAALCPGQTVRAVLADGHADASVLAITSKPAPDSA